MFGYLSEIFFKIGDFGVEDIVYEGIDWVVKDGVFEWSIECW